MSGGERAAMEGQSEDCPFLPSSCSSTVSHCCRNGGAVGRLPVSVRRGRPIPPVFRPQWRGSRKTARFRRSLSRTAHRNIAAMEGQSEDCPFRRMRATGRLRRCSPQWRGSRKTARFTVFAGQGNGRLTAAAMEGQSEDCPFRGCHIRGRRRLLGRNGGAVGRLPVSRRLESTPYLHTRPQWRGSRKTARFIEPNSGGVHRGRAAMEGQSEDCPFHTTPSPHPGPACRRNGGAVGRLPVSWSRRPGRTIGRLPQWRGSRKTARFLPLRRITQHLSQPQWRGSRKTARFPGSLTEQPSARPSPQWRGSRKTARFRVVGVVGPAGAVAAMEGQSEDCPFLAATAGHIRFDPSRNGGAVGRLPVSQLLLHVHAGEHGPQWRGSRKTARFDANG